MRILPLLRHSAVLATTAVAAVNALSSIARSSPGCLGNGQKLQSTTHLPHIIELEGQKASLSYPLKYDGSEPVPIIVAFHDAGQTVKDFIRASQMSNNTLNDKAVVAFPHRPEHGWISEEQYRNSSIRETSSEASKVLHNQFKWVITLLHYLENSFCLDETRVYATGLGAGAGLVHLLACHKELAPRFAAFSLVNAALYKSDEAQAGLWSQCNARTTTTPLLEIHSNGNTEYRYFGKKGEPALRLPDWLTLWSEKNDCGVIDGPTTMSDWSPASYVTKLTHGQVSEAMMYGGGASRVSYRCKSTSGNGDETIAQEFGGSSGGGSDEDEISAEQLLSGLYGQQWTPEPDDRDDGATVLHYSLHGPGHGWLRGNLKHEEMVVVNGVEVAAPGDPYFDTTRVVLDWLASHSLPRLPGLNSKEKHLKTTPETTGRKAEGNALRDEL